MSSTTPGTQVQTNSPISFRAVRWILVATLAAALALLGWARHESQLESAYEDAFQTGGVEAVVEHAADQGDELTTFPGGAYGRYGCYLDDGALTPHITLDECRDQGATVAAVVGG